MNSASLERQLGHEFNDPGLLKNALTHRSHSPQHNERLEFLGDGILNFIVASQLFHRYPLLPEGDLSRLRSLLVCQESLHQLALKLHLGEFLFLGEGELKSGGHQRPSILADTLEALFGAIYLDAGFDKAATVVSQLFEPLWANLPTGQRMKDPKTRLQEWLQGKRHGLPKYSLQGTQGEAHSQNFEVLCEISVLNIRTLGQGSSRRLAEQVAAERALELIKP